MGLKFKEIVPAHPLEIKELRGKVLAVDSLNMLYQFLTTIRGAEGSLFTNSRGRVTSHLLGLFNRTTVLMEEGTKLVFVFDGKAPEIKQKTWERRTAIKKEAALKFQEAKDVGDIEEMRRYSTRTAILTPEMIDDAKRLITTLGLPIVQAPSEGEAQTAFMVAQGDAYASVSQDYDNLIFGCPRLIRNLSLTGKRKQTGKLGLITVKPEMILLQEVLGTNNLTPDQLILAALLVGTDYNPQGIKGIGPKKALKLIHEKGADVESLFSEVGWETQYPSLSWKTIFDTIKYIPVTREYTLRWKKFDEKALWSLLVETYEFSRERVHAKIEKLLESQSLLQQTGLKGFF